MANLDTLMIIHFKTIVIDQKSHGIEILVNTFHMRYLLLEFPSMKWRLN